MIKLHRLNGQEVIVNAEIIESIESVPDTVITLHTGNRLIVTEPSDIVKKLVIEYKKSLAAPAPKNTKLTE